MRVLSVISSSPSDGVGAVEGVWPRLVDATAHARSGKRTGHLAILMRLFLLLLRLLYSPGSPDGRHGRRWALLDRALVTTAMELPGYCVSRNLGVVRGLTGL